MQKPYSDFIVEWTNRDRGLRKAVAYACRTYVQDDNNFPKDVLKNKDNLTEKYDHLVTQINRFENSSPRIILYNEHGTKKLTKVTVDNWVKLDDSTRQKPPSLSDEDVAIKTLYFFQFGVKDQSGNADNRYYRFCIQNLENHGVIAASRANRKDFKKELEPEPVWNRKNYIWKIDDYAEPPIDEEFASISVSTTQSATCEHPIGILIDVFADSIIDELTRIRLNFKSFRIVSAPNSYSKRISQTHNKNPKISNNGEIVAQGSKNSKFFDLITSDSFLCGNYATLEEPLFSILPEDKEIEIETVLKVEKSEANAVFPNDVVLPSDLKKQIINRVLTNEKFPHSIRQDSVELHRIKQKIKAVEKNV